jgi:anti-sigma-K factor RskA
LTIENHIPADDLVLFALQLLPEDRMGQTRQHAAACEHCRGEIARLQGDLAAYSSAAEMQTPAPNARERFMRQLAREPKLVTSEPEPLITMPERRSTDRKSAADSKTSESRPPEPGEAVFPTRQSRSLDRHLADKQAQLTEERHRPRRAPWVFAWTGWAVAAGCALVAGVQVHQREQVQNSMAAQQAHIDEMNRKATTAQDALATLTAANALQMPLHPTAAEKSAAAIKPGAPVPEALAAYLAEKGALVFIATHMQPAPQGKTYELWLLPESGRKPIPAGTFKPDAQGSASVVMPQLPKGVTAKGFGVTIENEGGSDTPTLPIIMAGT